MAKRIVKQREIKSRKNGLTSFEFYLNISLSILVILAVFLKNTSETTVYSFALHIFFLFYALPFDFGPNVTVYARKIENLIWHSLILLIMYICRAEVEIPVLGIKTPIICFLYFNLMRFLGELFIGKDPIWTKRIYVDQYNKTKNRIVTESDMDWHLVYGIVGLILCIIIENTSL